MAEPIRESIEPIDEPFVGRRQTHGGAYFAVILQSIS